MNNCGITIVHTAIVAALLSSFPRYATKPLETEMASPKRPATPVRILRRVFKKLRVNARVPVLLPSTLPVSVDVNKIHFVDGETKPDGYEIWLGYERDCGQACQVGYFAAERGRKPEKDEADKIVRLAHGLRGYYLARSCGVSCTPPQISWLYRGVLYTVQFNVNGKNARQDENEIVALANSTIRAADWH